MPSKTLTGVTQPTHNGASFDKPGIELPRRRALLPGLFWCWAERPEEAIYLARQHSREFGASVE
jgi:hypothetical protein